MATRLSSPVGMGRPHPLETVTLREICGPCVTYPETVDLYPSQPLLQRL